ncbi:MAG: hypothetical protein GWO86_03850 [Planctomycetes bacterium]|nr:hypothetical protein [Planctomycetota bacterium]
MAIEAALCKYKKNNLRIGIVVLAALAAWFYFDGYHSEKFIKNNTNADGTPNSTLVFNRKSPPWLLAGVVLLAGYYWVIRNKKLVADEQSITFSAKEKISYSAIQSVNKTNFDSKGYFVITYKDEAGNEKNRKISDKTYDNLAAILELLVSKIT